MGNGKIFASILVLGFLGAACASPPPPPECPPPPAPAPPPPPPAPPQTTAEPKGASSATKAANDAFVGALDFGNTKDFDDAKKGFLGTWDQPTIQDEKGRPVWDFAAFDFLKGEAPAEVNPSLWRVAQLNSMHGLFQVTDNIFQVRGFDLSVMSIIEGKTGVVVVDPLISKETAAAALKVYRKHRGDKPVVAVIYTHSHVDHFGGVRGIVDEKDVKSGKVKIVAPIGFMKSAVSENVFAGNAMSRRATYMYGPMLPKGARGTVDAGLGKTTSTGEVTLIAPTDTVSKTGQKMRLAGIEFVFLNAPHSEAPSEMLFYIPSEKALCAAEDVTHTLHNLYTLRGAEVRDPLLWSSYLQEVLQTWGKDVQVLFASHHWPTWGNDQVTTLIGKQRDLYRYINDQTLHLANQGYTMLEIAEMLELPPEQARFWANRGYYGTMSHNVKAVYQRYLGWFDGNPSHLHALPPVEASKKYVEFMGGSAVVIEKALASAKAGELRWAAQVLDHVVFAEPENEQARLHLADVLEQLGYRAESGPWRGFYLTGAMELRKGVRDLPAPNTASNDVVAGMTVEMFLDFMAVRLDAKKAAGKTISLTFAVKDGKKTSEYAVRVENGVLTYVEGKPKTPSDVSLTLERDIFLEIAGGKLKLADAKAQKKVTVGGSEAKLDELLGLFGSFDFWFPIVTP
ncbi:MAG TPA: alkyl sulfatase dimerization domain-containing protein [Polyangiaceae bacterium]|nr:alkyl sulfatase dimerization domain-containing protein [Polyangiaceae bacterium]